jgi:membrane-associated protease RseP (regulator of RpoE activity)
MIGFGIGVAILFFLVLVHELGHLVMARLCGIPVVSFSVGFGPAALKWRRGETTYRLCVLPLGGYIQYREDQEEERRPWALASVYLAGPAANIALTALVLGWLEGGVVAGITQTIDFGVQILDALAGVVATADFGSLGGPILVSQWAGAAAAAGLEPLLRLGAALSMNLAVLNLLPVPVLDGGRAIVLAAEGVQGRPMHVRLQRWVAVSGLAMLLAFMLVALANDLARLVA